MAKTYSTDLEIKSLTAGPTQYEAWDGDPSVPGLGIRISPGGTKSFVLVYRMGGRSRRLTLGKYGVISLAEARQRGRAAIADVAIGVDPQAAKVKSRETYSDRLCENVVKAYIGLHAKPNTRTWKETERVLMREFVKRCSDLTIQQITRGHILAVLDDVARNSGGSSANHAYAHIRGLLNWCVQRGYISLSPCVGMKRPAKSVKRDRVLTDDELVAIWRVAEQMGYPFGFIILLLILTGQRKSEVTDILRSDINRIDKTWILSPDSNKSGRTHIVPLDSKSSEYNR